jgi:hypothetical protein
MLPATTVIIATKGQLGRVKEAVDIHAGDLMQTQD